MSLRVLAPGTFALVVDGGRPRTRSLGIPVGGPADRMSLALGNALVGNSPSTAALEITLSGPTLVAEDDVGMCVFGAPFQIVRDGEALEPRHTFTLRRGQTLRIGAAAQGCRAYLCVPGGLAAPLVLGSCTAFAPLEAGAVLKCSRSELDGRTVEVGFRINAAPIQCLPGPQADWFDNSFYARTYRVSSASNRMGVRLDGPAVRLPSRELASEPVVPGAIQITNEGQPIVLGVDGQTIGGYPKIAHVSAADLDRIGQLRPGDEVSFQLTDERTAETNAAQRRTETADWLRRIRAMAC